MKRIPILVACLAAFAVLSHAQQVQYVEMRITLLWANGQRLNSDKDATGLPSTGDSRSAGSGERVGGNSVSNMEIRVILLNDDGSTVGEGSPDGEGVVKFHVVGSATNPVNGTKSYPAYRLRVRGTNIEEQIIDGLQPGLGDRMTTVELHRKGEKKSAGGGLISAAGLKIPRAAEKEFQKGQKELAKNKLPEARVAFEHAVTIYSKYDQAYNGLGVVLMKQGDPAGGRKAFEQAVAANDKFAPGYVNLARLQALDKNYDAAAASLSRSLSLEPLNAEALSMLCQYDVIREKYDEVPALAQKMHSVPHDGQALGHFAAGSALEHLNRPTDAIYEYMLFIQEDPTSKLAAAAKQEVDRLRQMVGQTNSPQ